MEKTNFPAMLKQFQPQIELALPKHLSADRMTRVALTAFRKNPKLAKCDPLSVFAAVIQSAQLGLELDQLGRGYLVPYGKECQFIPGWKGLVDLCNRTRQASVWTGAVFTGDEFDYALGGEPFCTHKPMGESSPNKLLYVYCIGRIVGAEWPVIECWPIKRVITHRDKYNKVGKSHYSFSNLEMYARKVVLLQVLKYLPSSTELTTAVALAHDADLGVQKIVLDDAIEGVYHQVDTASGDNEVQSNSADMRKPQAKKQTENKADPKTNQAKPQVQTSKPVIDPNAKADTSGFSFDDVVFKINNAATQDDIDLALDILTGLTQEQKVHLEKIAVVRSKQLVSV